MKKLSEICKRIRIKETNVEKDSAIKGIAIHSQKIKEGFVFFVTPGNEKYIEEAINAGAVCLIAEKAYEYPCIVVEDVRESLALCCSDFYDNPEQKLKMIGVVGTNGKTSVAHIINELCKGNKKAGVIGTLGVYLGEEKISTGMTTPDPTVLFAVLKKAVEYGMEYMICEITAHAIYYKKTFGIRWMTCVFTNITQDHLDFFKTMEQYAKIKTGFFRNENMKLAIVNADDPYGETIIKKEGLCCVSYGIDYPSDVFAVDITMDNGAKFVINAFDDIIFAKTGLEGRFNVYNILAGVTVAKIMGIEAKVIEKKLAGLSPIEGRANIVCSKPKVVIDFAHTPDGLKNILSSMKAETKGKLIAVFGCGGNRDVTKRPIMGKIATDIADVCIITSDNPRYEEPEKIIEQIVSTCKDRENYICITDRTNAIEFAVKLATEDDCVVICGKGGEDYMEIKGEKVPYSDKDVCKSALEKVKWLKF